ncbi:MAG: phosphoribosylformylglycinamidine synthase subunit PurQ [Deltaproteobacteria bacterium]|nr:phosphoribosylformylglycinamidine synthase subunit PurQ [Deltaproteobacteria bacterium]
MKFGVVVFAGSNCDRDCFHVVSNILNQDCVYVWHKEKTLPPLDCVILPGGFSYGDYLRAGAIARFSPVMNAVREFSDRGGLVLGICNGFQILLEAGILEGAMRLNACGSFVCRHVNLRCENYGTTFTRGVPSGKILNIPIAHAEGNYYAPPEVMSSIERNGQVVLRYCDVAGNVDALSNPNGAAGNIAGIVNKQGNVFGLMPHPERASEAVLGSDDGLHIFRSILKQL